ncbi:hypothetical protein [Microbispora sp. GKU 823]|uniref:hypothetical protein n=1 Tax=Microbispora sp. GKU 823 TaxID=1652100 RepID=UPI00117F0B38|nr:hypothetical protein [Microbispora sp. GKU 823]
MAVAAAVAGAVTWAVARRRTHMDPTVAPAGEHGRGGVAEAGSRAGGGLPGPTGAPGAAVRIALAVLASVAVTAAVTAFTVHGVTTGPVPELARRDATVTAEAEITDDPRIRPHQGGVSRRETAVVRARMLLVSAPRSGSSWTCPSCCSVPATGGVHCCRASGSGCAGGWARPSRVSRSRP